MGQASLGEVAIGGYVPGAIGRVTELHAAYYAREWNFGLYFEAKVAAGLAEFLLRFDAARDGFWTASLAGSIEGAIAIDGLRADSEGAHLRWFILSESIRGHGIGNRLMREAIGFCESRKYRRVFLFTFEGLHAARHLYERFGFRLADQAAGTQWGRPVTEQRFVLELETGCPGPQGRPTVP
jgi:GNAT superfamily N-acetyltransferase